MAGEEKSFEDLVREAPVGGTVWLVGTLMQSSEAGKFVLNLQDGSAVTLETASVKGHTVLGSSAGQPILRIDVETGKMPASAYAAARSQWNQPFTLPALEYHLLGTGFVDPLGPNTAAEVIPDPYGIGGQVQPGTFAPFALATPPQAPPDVRAALLAYSRGFGTAFETVGETGAVLDTPLPGRTHINDLM